MPVKVVFEESVAGPNFAYKSGRTYTLTDEPEAFRFIEKGIVSAADEAGEKAYAAWKSAKDKGAAAKPVTPPIK